MIVVYAPYPSANLVRNGWMRRVATIDRILADRERAYVFPADPASAGDWRDYRICTHQVAPGATLAYLDFRFSSHHRRLTDLVRAAELVYAHTSHSCQYLLPYYATGKIVTDLHGIAPEEEELQGKPQRAAFYAQFEETMVRQSAALVTVTQAMGEHFRRKYPGSDRPTIQLPIVEDLGDGHVIPRPRRARPIVVYVGGVQPWQNVDRMLQIVAACRERYEFHFYTETPDALRDRARAHGVGDVVRVGTATPEELPAIHANADFGFVLRDDIAVNRVSCPTKLSEYLAFGVVPVVALAEIGDFAAMGYRYVTADDLLAGRLPDEPTLAAMRQRNREVFVAIRDTFTAGGRRLRELRIDAPAAAHTASNAFLTTLERTMFFPVRGARLEVERGDGTHRIVLDEIVQARADLQIVLPGHGPVHAVHFRPGDAPFVTTPIQLELVDGSGGSHTVALRGTHAVDAYGNWCFSERDAAVEGADLPGVAAERLRVRYEYLLIGTEALVAGPPPPRSVWQLCARMGAELVPGARSAWAALRRLRHR